jgi:hypothetical protein
VLQSGRYDVWRTTVHNNDGNPDGGSDPQWTHSAQLNLSNGPTVWTDLQPYVRYASYVVTHSCP